MAHGDAREGKWRRNWRMEWLASTLYTTSEHGVSSITTADAHTSTANSWLNWRPCWFKWTRSFRRKRKSGFCPCAIIFKLVSTTHSAPNFFSLFQKHYRFGDRHITWSASRDFVNKLRIHPYFSARSLPCFTRGNVFVIGINFPGLSDVNPAWPDRTDYNWRRFVFRTTPYRLVSTNQCCGGYCSFFRAYAVPGSFVIIVRL